MEATPYLSSTLGSLKATRGDGLYPPSESGALAHARSPDLLGVIQRAALWASDTRKTCRGQSILVRLPWDQAGRHYLLEDTDLQKLLMWPIVKVEVELADGQIKDFKVSKRQGKKVLKGLQNCWRSLK